MKWGYTKGYSEYHAVSITDQWGYDGCTERFGIKKWLDSAMPGKKLTDGHGLYLIKSEAGTGLWRLKYRFAGKERTISFGAYSDVPLLAARTEARQVKEMLRLGKDPVTERKLAKAAMQCASADTFSEVAKEWLAMKKREWSSVHYTKSVRALERDVFPHLGELPVSRISRPMAARTIERISQRGALETASRILQHVNGVFRYAQAKGLCEDNPATTAREILPRKKDQKLMSALLQLPKLGDLLRSAKAASASPSVKMAHRLIAFTAARISNVVQAEWAEFDLDGEVPVWTIPRTKLKKKDARFPALRIPLAPSLVAELRDWRGAIGGKGYVFPSPSNPSTPITREALEKFYRVTLGLKEIHSPHGWRSSLTTLAKDHGMDKQVVDLATDHAHDTETAVRYDRGERYEQRIALFTWWAIQLLSSEQSAAVHALHGKRKAA
nr:integrase arm-type DNA-binding domain-containing protein [Pseudoduganella violaceinigra]